MFSAIWCPCCKTTGIKMPSSHRASFRLQSSGLRENHPHPGDRETERKSRARHSRGLNPGCSSWTEATDPPTPLDPQAPPHRSEAVQPGAPQANAAVRRRPAARASVSPPVHAGPKREGASCAAPPPSPVFSRGPGGGDQAATTREPSREGLGPGEPRARGRRADVSGLSSPRALPARVQSD